MDLECGLEGKKDTHSLIKSSEKIITMYLPSVKKINNPISPKDNTPIPGHLILPEM